MSSVSFPETAKEVAQLQYSRHQVIPTPAIISMKASILVRVESVAIDSVASIINVEIPLSLNFCTKLGDSHR